MGKGRNHRLGGGEGSKGERRRFDGRGKDNTGKFGLRRNRGGDKLKPVPFSENSAEAASISVYKRPTVYPAAYIGPAQPLPHVGFVEPSNKDTYEQLLATSYKGFVHDSPHVHDDAFHRDFRQAFETMDGGNIFQYDMTQPHGLGTKVARTFVTRCLVGEPGITYKYLGIRMFSHPWTEGQPGASAATVTVGRLNDLLVVRSKELLKTMAREQVGATAYNLTLINRCFPLGEVRLKDEPYYGGSGGGEKCTVSWHADSSLDHFSSIGVYHCLKDASPAHSGDRPWRVALRVEHDSEGPTAGKLKTARSGAEANGGGKSTPPVAVPLEDGASYHLLDDFNHHHQHCVLAGSTHRYASTHRVGRTEGHCYSWILAKCKTAAEGPRRDSAKQLRAEQHALSEVEFEWLRQFYIQGKAHWDLHTWWHAPMKTLQGLWQTLEWRTAKVVDDLKLASEGVPALEARVAAMPQDERRKASKKLAKTRKRLETVDSKSYDVLIEGLQDRLDRRRGFAAREKDPSFADLAKDCRPLPVPFFSSPEYAEGGGLGCDFNDMEALIKDMARWKQAFLAL